MDASSAACWPDGSHGPTAEAGLESGAAAFVAITTVPDLDTAQRLARHLVEKRLAGCISLMPLQSVYLWQGALEEAAEVQLQMKTSAERIDDLRRAVLEMHPYSTPMWIQWPADANQAYGAWLHQVTRGGDGSPPAGED